LIPFFLLHQYQYPLLISLVLALLFFAPLLGKKFSKKINIKSKDYQCYSKHFEHLLFSSNFSIFPQIRLQEDHHNSQNVQQPNLIN